MKNSNSDLVYFPTDYASPLDHHVVAIGSVMTSNPHQNTMVATKPTGYISFIGELKANQFKNRESVVQGNSPNERILPGD